MPPKAKLKKPKDKKKKKKGKVKKPTISKKELNARKKQRAKMISEAIGALVTYGGIGAVVGTILFFVANEKLAIAGGGGIAVLALSYKYPMMGLWAFLIYLPFSGTITYWVGGGNAIFQLAKDGFYIPALIALVLQLKKKKQPFLIEPKIKIPLYILLGFC